MKDYWISTYSPTRDGTCYIRSCGHCCVGREHREKIRMVNFLNIYWCTDGSGFFRSSFKEKYTRITPGEIWCMTPGDYHDFYPGEEGFQYYWLAVAGEALPTLLPMLKLSAGKKFCGSAPDELFAQILAGLSDLTPEKRMEILGFAFQILFKIAAASKKNQFRDQENDSPKKMAAEARELMEREFCNPAFNINRLAAILVVHRVTLCREFKKEFHISPQAYLRGCRLRKAMELLNSGNCSIKEIAYACGFSSPEYFATVFAAEFGSSPSHFGQITT